MNPSDTDKAKAVQAVFAKTLTEDRAAIMFRQKHEDRLRFDNDVGQWYVWQGTHWKLDRTNQASDWVRNFCRSFSAPDMEKRRVIKAVEDLARVDQVFSITSERWNPDPWLLGTPKGTVDLRTGIIRPARPADFINKVANAAPVPLADFDPGLDCPLWLTFLKEATGNDAGMIRFLQQWCGYCLTGITKEQVLVYLFGEGGRGKGTFLNTIRLLMRDYAEAAPITTFATMRSEQHPTDLAGLQSARLVTASEPSTGMTWNEERIKLLTGEDPVKARFMRQDFFQYQPSFKLTFMGNNPPAITNVDEAIRRRFIVVPFDTVPANKDPDLADKLKKEQPGILAWAIQGCLDWQANGLIRPESISRATTDYLNDQDWLRQWVEQCCDIGSDFKCGSTELLADYNDFLRRNGKSAVSAIDFSTGLKRKRFEPFRTTRMRGFHGIRLREQDDDNL